MANNKKISQLSSAGTLDGTELVPVVKSGVTKQTTVQDIADLGGGGGGGGVQSVSGNSVDNTDPLNPIILDSVISPDTFTGLNVYDGQASLGSSDGATNVGNITIEPTNMAQSVTDGVDTSTITILKDSIDLDSTSVTKSGVEIATSSDVALKSNIASPTFTGTVTTPAIIVSSETASRVAIIDGSKNVKSADTATYPSLTELAYLKGATSAVQTQLSNKVFTISFECGNWSPADSTIYYISDVRLSPNTSETNFSFNLGYDYTIIGAKVGVGNNTVTGSTELVTGKIRNITQGTSSTVGTFETTGSSTLIKSTTFTGLSISVASGDSIAFRMETPVWATNPTACIVFVTLICTR